MKSWHKAAIITLISLAIGGIYLFSVFHIAAIPASSPTSTLKPVNLATTPPPCA